ncbi:AMP-binding protein [Desulfofundulus thermobenzoicus]|uniref:AMP-binding protein n=1 Tax=Desulfofundulus thermobenzoicus TaxID=29376 RepID=A0A6N7IUS2_9FIRM|nr:AMP-binding protein [Desulfofundulus thermobenzoicus]MQL53830.1 AMP-binding protein [Desulfofundulus thermobenzoicus]HHW43903.1 AMP-binding protein [Desulfotomaculum sp.]
MIFQGGITVGDLLDRAADLNPRGEALVYPDRDLRLTYRAFREACDRVARGLMALGIKRGEHIAVWAPNVPQWVLLQFASARTGAVLVTVNTSYKSFELEYLLKNSDVTTLFLTAGVKDADYIAMINELCPELAHCLPGRLNARKFPMLRNIVFIGDQEPPGMYTWEQMLWMGEAISPAELRARQSSLDPDDGVNMQYTSGTTGFPKGVMLTHNNLVGNALGIAQCLNFGPEDRLCIPVPFFHCFGCVLGTLTCVASGATMVPLETFNPVKVLETVEKERCTALHGVPTMFITELEVLEKQNYDVSSLRTGIMAGSPCPMEVMRKVVERMNMREIVITYGQTEASPGITMTRTSDPIEVRVATVGRALPGVEVKVVDPATGEEVPRGFQGEICARGYNVMKGYYKMPEATAAAIDEDGWLHTGDLGIMDENGYLHITGRLKDMIIRGGENIYPREIEEFLYTHPKVKDVQVVGVPSLKYGEEVMAFIQLKEGCTATPEEIKEFCRGKIARYKIPQYIQFVPGYPTTANGKVQKFKLREQAIHELGLYQAARVETA